MQETNSHDAVHRGVPVLLTRAMICRTVTPHTPLTASSIQPSHNPPADDLFLICAASVKVAAISSTHTNLDIGHM
jgi:hypothetical protein